MKKHAIFILFSLFQALWPLSSSTVIVSYDLILPVIEDGVESAYARITGAELEDAIMNEIFDRGHIVFNYPGETYVHHDKPIKKTRSITQSMRAMDSGAELFIHFSLYFDGNSEEDLYLNKINYKIFRIGNYIIDQNDILYLKSPRINGIDASELFFERVSQEDFFEGK